MALTDQEVRNFVFQSLGDGLINVELDEPKFQVCLQLALDTWNTYKPRILYKSINVSDGASGYALDQQGIPKGSIRGVLYANPDWTAPQLKQIEFNYPFYQRLITITNVSEWSVLESWLESANRALSSTFDWRYWRETNTLYVANLPSTITRVSLTMTRDNALTDIESFDSGKFKKLVLGEMMRILSRVRRKFPIPGPSGTITLDGAELREEGDAYVKEVTDTLMNSGYGWAIPAEWDGSSAF